MSDYQFDLSTSQELTPAELDLRARLKADPGTVHYLDTDVLITGVLVFSAALDAIPAGHVMHVMSRDYPRIVGSLQAQGCRVRFDSLLTLVSTEDVGE